MKESRISPKPTAEEQVGVRLLSAVLILDSSYLLNHVGKQRPAYPTT